jgi:hypothetical protein
VFAPAISLEEAQKPPKKRRKLSHSKQRKGEVELAIESSFQFKPLLNGAEAPEFVELRQQLFKDTWEVIESRVQVVLTFHEKRSS